MHRYFPGSVFLKFKSLNPIHNSLRDPQETEVNRRDIMCAEWLAKKLLCLMFMEMDETNAFYSPVL